jgi:hypothetical protein
VSRPQEIIQACDEFGLRIEDVQILDNGAVSVKVKDGYMPDDLSDQMDALRIPPVGQKRQCVYFLKGLTTGNIKIGYSHDLRNRMVSIRTSCAERLQLLLVLDGDQSTEAAIHRILRPWRQRGEWFSDSEDVLHLIERCRQTPDQFIQYMDETRH